MDLWQKNQKPVLRSGVWMGEDAAGLWNIRTSDDAEEFRRLCGVGESERSRQY